MQEPTKDNILSKETSFFCTWKRKVTIKPKLKILLILIYLSLIEKRKQTYIVRFDCLT